MNFIPVELEGVEPSSKQGNHMPSTCLSQPSIFEYKQDLSHQLIPYPLNFIQSARQPWTIPDISAPLNQIASEKQHLSDVSFQHLVSKLSVIYYDSITQQERSYFRQLKFVILRLKCILSKHCMLTYHLYSLSKPVSPVF